jgi:hypothetical protein
MPKCKGLAGVLLKRSVRQRDEDQVYKAPLIQGAARVRAPMVRLFAYFITLSIAQTALAGGSIPLVEDTPEAACEVLQHRMAVVMALPHNEPDKHWFCDFTTEHNDYLYIIGLRSEPSGPGGSVPLIGWFAVARRSTLVVQVDVAEGRLVPISRSYYGAGSASKTKGPTRGSKGKP